MGQRGKTRRWPGVGGQPGAPGSCRRVLAVPQLELSHKPLSPSAPNGTIGLKPWPREPHSLLRPRSRMGPSLAAPDREGTRGFAVPRQPQAAFLLRSFTPRLCRTARDPRVKGSEAPRWLCWTGRGCGGRRRVPQPQPGLGTAWTDGQTERGNSSQGRGRCRGSNGSSTAAKSTHSVQHGAGAAAAFARPCGYIYPLESTVPGAQSPAVNLLPLHVRARGGDALLRLFMGISCSQEPREELRERLFPALGPERRFISQGLGFFWQTFGLHRSKPLVWGSAAEPGRAGPTGDTSSPRPERVTAPPAREAVEMNLHAEPTTSAGKGTRRVN